MCKLNNAWCVRMVKWNPYQKTNSLWCKTHNSFANEPKLSEQEFLHFKQHYPQMISKDQGIDWNVTASPKKHLS